MSTLILAPSPAEIQAARVRAGFTVAEACRLAGIKDSTLYRIEAGRVPRITTAKKLAQVYGVELNQLLAHQPIRRRGSAA